MPRKTNRNPTVPFSKEKGTSNTSRRVRNKNTKNKNKNKLVVKNVININSNNRKKVKPSFQQMAKDPPKASTVVTHFLQQPTSNFNPNLDNSFLRVNENIEKLTNKFNERDAQIQRQFNRLGRPMDISEQFNDRPKVSTNEIIEKGPTFLPRISTEDEEKRPETPNKLQSYIKNMFGGRTPTPLGQTGGSALTPQLSPPRSAGRGPSQEELNAVLQSKDEDDLRDIYKLFVFTQAPQPASKKQKIIKEILTQTGPIEHQRIASNWTAIKEYKAQQKPKTKKP